MMRSSLIFVLICIAFTCVFGKNVQLKDGVTEKPRMQLETVQPRQIEIVPNKGPIKDVDVSSRAGTVTCNGAPVSVVGTSSTYYVTVQSPNYPSNYPNNLGCVYSLSVPANAVMNITIAALKIECPYDILALSFNTNPPALTLCQAANYYISPQPSAYTFKVSFSTDSSVNYSGFQIYFYLDTSITTTSTTAGPTTATVTTASTTTVSTASTTTTALPAGTCTCGRFGFRSDEEDSDRIVGGTVAAANSIPYQIGLWTQTSSNPICGGSLISPNYVLTAAHCMPGFTATELRVAVGDVKYTVIGDGETFVNVAAITVHPSYNTNTQEFDFALLRLSTPVVASNRAGYICLPPDTTQTFAGTTMKISGWGKTSSTGTQSASLLYAYVNGTTNTECNSLYGGGITSNMICATGGNFTKDTCQGDSGGPLVSNVQTRLVQVGVTSFGNGCAVYNYPGVYSRVSAQKAWILANSDAANCQN